jgi:hypothetical protein
MKVSLIIIKFLLIGALFIVSNKNLYLSHQEDLNTFFDLYYSWLGTLYTHAMQISGYVVDVEWLPKNLSNPST